MINALTSLEIKYKPGFVQFTTQLRTIKSILESMRGNKHTYRHPGWEILLRNKSLKQTHTLDLAGKDQSINSGFRTKRPHNRLKLPLVFPWFRHFSPVLIRINKQLAFHSKHKTSKWRYSANISVPLVP